MRFQLLPHTVNEALPLIYMWEILELGEVLVGRYVGKAKAGGKRPLNHYRRNVANILSSKPYRKGNPGGYRRIHQALAKAEQNGCRISLQFLCNVAPYENINEIEQKYIRAYSCAGGEAWQLNA